MSGDLTCVVLWLFRGYIPLGVNIHLVAKNTNNTIMSRFVSRFLCLFRFPLLHCNHPPFPARDEPQLTYTVLCTSAGLSFKTQALYATVFIARYLDLVFRWVSLYNFVMKIFFIASSVYILYLMKMRFRCVFFFGCLCVCVIVSY
jgi:hypothetical protein